MKSKELKDGVHKNLGPFLLEHGYRKVQDGYKLKESDFAHSIVYSHLIGDNCRPTSFGFWVQSRSVYVILKNVFEQEVKKDAHTTLIGLNQATVFNLRPKEFQVDNYNDIVTMCNTVKQYLIEDGFNFFEIKKNYHDILNEMKTTTPPDNFYSLGFRQWSFNALILSKMTKDQDYEDLARKYLDFTKEKFGEGFFLRELDQLNNYLLSKSVEDLQNLICE